MTRPRKKIPAQAGFEPGTFRSGGGRLTARPTRNCQVVAQNCLLVGCLTSQQHASVSQGRICSDNFTCCRYDSTPKESRRKRDSNPGPSALEADAFPLGQRGGRHKTDHRGVICSRFHLAFWWEGRTNIKPVFSTASLA